MIEESTKKSEETVEDVDVTDCLDELGGLYLRKLVMLLKQDYNFNLESKLPTIQTKKYTTSCREDGSGSTVESTPSAKIFASAARTGKGGTLSSEEKNWESPWCTDSCPLKT